MYYVMRIELSEKQNNAEYAKQHRLKRKLLLQHQASTSSETEILQKQKKAEGIVPCIYVAVRHIHVKGRASLREAWFLFVYSLE
jgi:hypothetical protein